MRSIKEECLDRIVPLGERHFRRTLREFVTHYHGERNHQGLGNVLIDTDPPTPKSGRLQRRQRLGGLLSYYHRAAECRVADANHSRPDSRTLREQYGVAQLLRTSGVKGTADQ